MSRRKVRITGASGLIGGLTIKHLGDKYGISTIAIRLGAVFQGGRPLLRRHYPGYLSQSDCVQLIDKCSSARQSR